MDLLYDPSEKEMTLSGGDFQITSNPSVQNGGILQLARCPMVLQPLFGIGVEEIIEGKKDKASFEMSRWRSQCKNDGAKSASYSLAFSEDASSEPKLLIETKIDYI